MSGSFMQPELIHGTYFEVDTNDGIYFVPASVVCSPGHELQVNHETLRAYVDASTDPDTWDVKVKVGYLARYSAPGYLDCTDWIAGTNKRILLRELRELYS